MRLFEHESKELLRGYGIPVPKGILLEKGVNLASSDLKFPCILKAQVPIGGRGKAGGIVKVNNQQEAQEQTQRIFSLTIGGFPVASVLAEEVVIVESEFYLSMVVDRGERCYMMMVGSSGGVDIEQMAKERPSSILKLRISSLNGLSDSDIQSISAHIKMSAEKLSPIIKATYLCFQREDAELLEINPLGKTESGLIALDAKIVVDDNALFRHPFFQNLPLRGKPQEELEAEAFGLNYVAMDGNIGVIGNGAGLTLATMDLLRDKGGAVANFLDLGAGAQAKHTTDAVLFLIKKERIKGILINIFGGMTRCDEVARGIVDATARIESSKPIVVRLIGTNQESGEEVLRTAGIDVFQNPEQAAEKIVSIMASIS
jgi:succinyl-CoA synthetase beta subunit